MGILRDRLNNIRSYFENDPILLRSQLHSKTSSLIRFSESEKIKLGLADVRAAIEVFSKNAVYRGTKNNFSKSYQDRVDKLNTSAISIWGNNTNNLSDEPIYKFFHNPNILKYFNDKQLSVLCDVYEKYIDLKTQLGNVQLPSTKLKKNKSIANYDSVFDYMLEMIENISTNQGFMNDEIVDLEPSKEDLELIKAFKILGWNIDYNPNPTNNGSKYSIDPDESVNFCNDNACMEYVENGNVQSQPHRFTQDTVQSFLDNYFNKKVSERHKIVTPDSLFQVYMEDFEKEHKPRSNDEKKDMKEELKKAKQVLSTNSDFWQNYDIMGDEFKYDLKKIALYSMGIKNKKIIDRDALSSQDLSKFGKLLDISNGIENISIGSSVIVQEIQNKYIKLLKTYQSELKNLKSRLSILKIAYNKNPSQELEDQINDLDGVNGVGGKIREKAAQFNDVYKKYFWIKYLIDCDISDSKTIFEALKSGSLPDDFYKNDVAGNDIIGLGSLSYTNMNNSGYNFTLEIEIRDKLNIFSQINESIGLCDSDAFNKMSAKFLCKTDPYKSILENPRKLEIITGSDDFKRALEYSVRQISRPKKVISDTDNFDDWIKSNSQVLIDVCNASNFTGFGPINDKNTELIIKAYCGEKKSIDLIYAKHDAMLRLFKTIGKLYKSNVIVNSSVFYEFDKKTDTDKILIISKEFSVFWGGIEQALESGQSLDSFGLEEITEDDKVAFVKSSGYVDQKEEVSQQKYKDLNNLHDTEADKLLKRMFKKPGEDFLNNLIDQLHNVNLVTTTPGTTPGTTQTVKTNGTTPVTPPGALQTQSANILSDDDKSIIATFATIKPTLVNFIQNYYSQDQSVKQNVEDVFDFIISDNVKNGKKIDVYKGNNTVKCNLIGYIQQIMLNTISNHRFNMVNFQSNMMKFTNDQALINSISSFMMIFCQSPFGKETLRTALLNTFSLNGNDICFAGNLTGILDKIKDCSTIDEIQTRLNDKDVLDEIDKVSNPLLDENYKKSLEVQYRGKTLGDRTM